MFIKITGFLFQWQHTLRILNITVQLNNYRMHLIPSEDVHNVGCTNHSYEVLSLLSKSSSSPLFVYCNTSDTDTSQCKTTCAYNIITISVLLSLIVTALCCLVVLLRNNLKFISSKKKVNVCVCEFMYWWAFNVKFSTMCGQ